MCVSILAIAWTHQGLSTTWEEEGGRGGGGRGGGGRGGKEERGRRDGGERNGREGVTVMASTTSDLWTLGPSSEYYF